MGSKWKKVKMALGLNPCVSGPIDRLADNDGDDSERRLAAAELSASNMLGLSKSFTKSSSRKTCSICLASMRRGDGHAIFTAECSHSFHFKCIASNVKHGNRVCPVCRAKWKEIPVQGPSLDSQPGKARTNPLDLPQNNDFMTVVRRLPRPRSSSSGNIEQTFQSPEPAVFDDDESLDPETDSSERSSLNLSARDCDEPRKVNIKTYTEFPAITRFSTVDSLAVLLHIKAPFSNSWQNPSNNEAQSPKTSQTPRVPIDLVTVLDVSGSMAGTKLALLKQAMGFVIQNLGPNDRLSVIAFSSTARRLFPLMKMSGSGRQQALLAINSLVANGGTNIAEGLRKGAKIVEDRKQKNPVPSIILLSDGQDTYTVNTVGGNQNQPNYELLLPLSVRPGETSSSKIPVHAFGFGADHDALSLHSVSEMSGGTFSFIETEGAIQDAFAQCIGGLLSVVVQNLQIRIESADPRINLGSLKAGSYPNHISSNQQQGCIDVGDLYADEERDFLVSINVPAEISRNETSLLTVRCIYNDPLTKEAVTLEVKEVRIERTEVARQEAVSIEVDRQQNRIRAAEAMKQARIAAENGDLGRAVSTLENYRKILSETVSAKSRDRLCVALDAELKEMQERMASRRVYEASGRAYVLSGLSSHSWQRATARGDSTDSSSLVQSYQTRSMAEMVTHSQATLLGSPSPRRNL